MKKTLLAICMLFLTGSIFAQDNAKPPKLKIFILAGQSNMEGKGSLVTMKHQLADPAKRDRFAHLVDGEKWRERDDVWIDYLGNHGTRHGKLTAGYGKSQKDSRDVIGPELGFGWVMGDHYDQDILIIKAAWGGKSIDRDFRPPSRGYPDSITNVFENAKKRNADLTLEKYKESYGHFYRLMMGEIRKVTGDLKTYVPSYAGQGYEIAGFVWFQGWNDQYAPTSVEDYEENLVAMIQDIRQELGTPNMPVVIGAMGHNGTQQKGKIKLIADAQAAAANHEGFKGNVVTIRTTKYWDYEAEEAYKLHWKDEKTRNVDKWREFGNDHGYHYFGSPVFFHNAGKGFAEAMLKLSGQ